MNGVVEVSFGGKEPFGILGPGEYEKEGITIQGFLTKSEYGLPKGATSAVNTMYAVKLEGMTLVHLGALSEAALPPDAKEAIDEIDVLFVPVGGDGVLDPAEASKLATMLEPKVVIPMHKNKKKNKSSLDQFIKEEGGEAERMEKLTIKKKDLADKDGAIMVITP